MANWLLTIILCTTYTLTSIELLTAQTSRYKDSTLLVEFVGDHYWGWSYRRKRHPYKAKEWSTKLALN